MENPTVAANTTTETINRYTPPPSYEALREAHAVLERKVEGLTTLNNSLVGRISDAHRAIEIIGERLIDESNSRGWCDEFDRIIDEVNDQLPGDYLLPVREREYEVEWTETVRVEVSRSVTVRARNEDEARENAPDVADRIDTSDIIDSVRYGSWEVDEYSDPEYYVTEV